MRAAALVAVAVVAAGCGGATESPVLEAGPPGASGRPAEEPGKVFATFARAAARADARSMWTLLSEPTRASYGPTFALFARGTAARIADDFEDVVDLRVVLSREVGAGDWAVAAVQGVHAPPDDEPEPAAYAAALRREGGRWRIELGGVVVSKLDPDPSGEADARPVLSAEAQAGGDVREMLLWLDGRHLVAPEQEADPFTARVRGVPPGELSAGTHVAVVFAATGDTAGAVAWAFEVVD